MNYSYSINEHSNALTIYEGGSILCTIADIDEATDIDALVDDVIHEMRGA